MSFLPGTGRPVSQEAIRGKCLENFSGKSPFWTLVNSKSHPLDHDTLCVVGSHLLASYGLPVDTFAGVPHDTASNSCDLSPHPRTISRISKSAIPRNLRLNTSGLAATLNLSLSCPRARIVAVVPVDACHVCFCRDKRDPSTLAQCCSFVAAYSTADHEPIMRSCSLSLRCWCCLSLFVIWNDSGALLIP